MSEKDELRSEVSENISVRYGDVILTITADQDGVLAGKTREQMLKYCADLLLQNTEEGSLENSLDIIVSLQETLQLDYGWNPLDVTKFLSLWRKRLYLKQIGEENPVFNEITPFSPVEPSSDKVEPITNYNPETGQPQIAGPLIVDNANHSTISIPMIKKNLDDGIKETNSFSVIEREKP
jgi:hypothetical protein